MPNARGFVPKGSSGYPFRVYWVFGRLWANDIVLGASVSLAVNPSDVAVQISLPLAVAFFKGKIESAIREQLTRLLS
jgi:hypothetical protein